MLKNRILATLKFFDLQEIPLTLEELHTFLVSSADEYKELLNEQGELMEPSVHRPQFVSIDQVLICLDNECQGEAGHLYGFYHLPGRKDIVTKRLENYIYGIQREKYIEKYMAFARHIPFVRGVALTGSQALGQQKPTSDIDLLIITDPRYLWLTRTLVTAYFQIIGLRRHGKKIANRFCLNHYLSGPKKITELKNLYTAAEYLKLRPLVCSSGVAKFQKANLEWMSVFFPNATAAEGGTEASSSAQKFFERPLSGGFGRWLERRLKAWQLPKIRKEKFILVTEDELSFHPDSKQQSILAKFLGEAIP